MDTPHYDLEMLGRPLRGPVDHVETFPLSEAALATNPSVTFMTDELTAVCPVTGQPDIYELELTYQPSGEAVESKSLKHWLWGFRDESIFAEELAPRIATTIHEATGARWTSVRLTQNVRGGIVTVVEATAG